MSILPEVNEGDKRLKPFSAVTYCQLSVRMNAIDGGQLSRGLASILRGAFGLALSKTCCNNACEGNCTYHYLMETPLPKGSKSLRGYSHLPHPIIIRPPREVGTIKADDQLAFELVLIGKAIERFGEVVNALQRMGKDGIGKQRVKLRLVEVTQHVNDHSGAECERPLWNINTQSLGPPQINTVPMSNADAHGVSLQWLSPVHIVSEGKLLCELPFAPLVRALLRRMSSLALFHCEQELAIDYREIIEKAERIRVEMQHLKIVKRERYSSRQKRVLPLVGFQGEMKYSGTTIAEFLPLLQLGEALHVGKGTIFGMGQYKMRIQLSEIL